MLFIYYYVFSDQTEEALGKAIKESDVPREELFITTKLHQFFHRPEHVRPVFDRSLDLLQMDYVDMYMMHWPFSWEFKGYGFEDFDLRNRLKLLGRKFVRIPKENFLNAISHSDVERLENEYNNIAIKHIYIKHKTPSMSELVYCFNNNEVYTGCIVKNSTLNSESIQNLFITKENYIYNIALVEDSWKIGQFISYDKIVFPDQELSIANRTDYIEVINDKFCSSLIMLFSQITNRTKMNKNLKQNRIIVNNKSYGETCLE